MSTVGIALTVLGVFGLVAGLIAAIVWLTKREVRSAVEAKSARKRAEILAAFARDPGRARTVAEAIERARRRRERRRARGDLPPAA